jgi:hypothetical protein
MKGALHRLTRGGKGGLPVSALIVTTSGRPHETPLAVVVTDDLPKLSSALVLI